jgi:hypothetical protein
MQSQNDYSSAPFPFSVAAHRGRCGWLSSRRHHRDCSSGGHPHLLQPASHGSCRVSYGLFPAIDSGDPEWNFRIAHYGHLLGDSAEETLRGLIRFINVQHHYQILLRRGMGQLIGIAQGHYRNADRQVTQIVELQALVTEKEEIITAREEAILHREDQINESDAIITQRNTIIEFLQEQIHDLILEVDDTHAHIDELQQQLVPPAVTVAPEGGEEDPEEIEGVSDLDSEHGDPEPNP